MPGGDKFHKSHARQLPPQAVHIHRQCVLVHKAVRLPQPLHQLLPADHLPGALHQAGQDTVLVLGQLHRLPLIGQLLVVGGQLCAPPLPQHRRRRHVIAAPQHGLYLDHQHAAVKGLGDKIVRAEVHGHDDVHVITGRGQKQDGRTGLLPQLPAPVIAVKARQGDIQYNEVRLKFRRLRRHRPKVPCAPDLQSPALRQLCHRLGDGPVVLHNKYTVHTLTSFTLFIIPSLASVPQALLLFQYCHIRLPDFFQKQG